MGLFDSESEETVNNSATDQYAESYGVNMNGNQNKVALPNALQLNGRSKFFQQGGGSDYTGQYKGATVIAGGGINSSGMGNTLTINAPDQMFDLLEQVVSGSQSMQAETLQTVRNMQTGAETQLKNAYELSERVTTQTGEVIAFIKQATPFLVIGSVVFIAGKKLLEPSKGKG